MSDDDTGDDVVVPEPDWFRRDEDFRTILPRPADRTKLAKGGITDVDSLLRHFPRRWVDPGEFTDIRALGMLEEGTDVVLHVTVVEVASRRMQSRRGTISTVSVTDSAGGFVDVVFFNQPWIGKILTAETRILVSARIKHYRGRVQLSSPTLLTGDGRIAEDERTGDIATLSPSRPVPVYPTVGGVTSTRMHTLITTALDTVSDEWFVDTIPAPLRDERGLVDLRTGYDAMHRPTTMADVHSASPRWAYEEALALQTVLLQRRREHEALSASALEGKDHGVLAAFDAALPFELTLSQEHAGIDIGGELTGNVPMNRLLQGDVGSGKTLVAVRGMLQAIDSGAQAALLAPTEVLAAQHYRSITAALGEFAAESALLRPENGVVVALLTGSLSTAERRRILIDLAIGDIDLIVGTHALLSKTTIFAHLGMVVVDEQHRFGVEQREALRQKAGGKTPHTLVMTATPIPRTAAMTVFGDLDVSTLDHMPSGRREITTHLVPLGQHPHWEDRVIEVIGEHAARCQQAFVVLPRIEASSPDEATGAPQPGVEDYAEHLRGSPALADVRIEVLHGQMPAQDKDDRMRAFAEGDIDVLVSTTVIEVGIDVPNARVMVIVDADRFGVAQLHQLRGRVGRAGDSSLCFLLSHTSEESEAYGRLQKVASTLDGFELAEYDIRTRREGDVLGRAQWGGRSSLRHLSVLRDETIIKDAREDAAWLLDADPALDGNRALARLIARIFSTADEDLIEAS
ncbi:ATP-dependent DNA helicase RecG [Brevibacterium jeotgali]|uniref:ATP-dependent DNA helicase RecG n=1 Tax=Brevibacterium jeotgali TaxID=1262550 RepID=A0A2H1L2X2_9MICO|nr:ATP-dependent DNA helicase RecG [Brevibacterium jeotgali]TWC02460.1 ATP-dependent DNA helicase RecG [Brevibacterium jeotgali]SMY11252.1 ATP-dependent DNA helicase RecG [Brevibacterium jeotgali]